MSDNTPSGEYASPPCFMHDLDASTAGVHMVDSQQRKDVMRWRKAERKRLIGQRLAVPADERAAYSARIAKSVEALIGAVDGLTVSAYWPFRGEPDLRPLLGRICEAGGRCALPVVIERGRPLIFRYWRPGNPLERGIWNIPIPLADAGEANPDIVVSPVVGFDPACYRLGYGGGFYDRTLAAKPVRPRVIGVGYADAAIPTIYPQPHDIAMDVIVTERDVRWPDDHAHRPAL